VNQEVELVANNTDPSSLITKQDYFLDDVAIDSLLVTFDKLGSYIFKVVTYWNNGFEEVSFIETLTITLANQIPTTNLEVELLDGKYYLNSNAIDPEGS